MFPLPLKTWLYIGVALVVVGLALAVKVQTARLEAEKAAFSAFKAQVELIGKEAEKAAKTAEAANLQAKEQADRENKKSRTAIATLTEQLRKHNTPISTLPSAPAASSRPDLLCLDRAEYQRTDGEALARLYAGARGLADEGTAATVDLDTAKEWTRYVARP